MVVVYVQETWAPEIPIDKNSKCILFNGKLNLHELGLT